MPPKVYKTTLSFHLTHNLIEKITQLDEQVWGPKNTKMVKKRSWTGRSVFEEGKNEAKIQGHEKN